MSNPKRHRRLRLLTTALAVGVLAALSAFGGTATGAQRDNAVVTVDTLPITNGRPLFLGIQKGFFDKQGITIQTKIFNSGNDIVLALENHQGDIGYLGYVPAMIARTQGIPLSIIAASEVEGTNATDNWQDILVKGSSSIKTPADLAGKTIAANALKGVGETVIRAALKKSGVDPNSIKLIALPFPAMRAALANGQVDAVWTPEPFLSQILSDGGRIVMAPGPVLGKYFPNGGYGALHDFTTHNPGLTKRFRTAINQSLLYAQNHPNEILAMPPALPATTHLPIWSPLIDRKQLLTLAKYAKEFGVIPTLPNFTQLVPSTVKTGVVKKKHK